MSLFDVSNDRLDQMAGVMRPEHYVGFLLGAAFLALVRSPEPDSAAVQRLMDRRTKFAKSQRADGEPDGLPVPPVYWTEEHGPFDDREELLACMELGSVFALHSSAKPHMQWVSRLPVGEDDVEIRTFVSPVEGKRFLDRRHEEIAEAWKVGIAEVKRLYRLGSVDAAEAKMEELGPVEFSATIDDPGHVKIEGERIPVGVDAGKPQVPRTLAPDAV